MNLYRNITEAAFRKLDKMSGKNIVQIDENLIRSKRNYNRGVRTGY